jgi:hypothetical protein
VAPPGDTHQRLLAPRGSGEEHSDGNRVPHTAAACALWHPLCPQAGCAAGQVNGSLARAAIRELAEKGMIRAVAHHGSQAIYTRATNVEEEVTKDKKPKKGATADKAEKPEKGATADKAAKPEAEKADKAEKAEA